jgi:EAL domain-containing protein (putative c-di-GMP-specific phosphodiesterase class I)
VEEASQSAELIRLACEQGQGFLFARPLEPLTLETFLLTEQYRQDKARSQVEDKPA